jgi:hypothetical protein
MELVVGTAIAGLILSAGIGALGLVQDRAEAADRTVADALSAATVRSTIVSVLEGARYEAPARGSQDYAFQGLEGTGTILGSDEIFVPTSAKTPVSGVGFVRLYVDLVDSTAVRGLVAAVQEDAFTPPTLVQLAPEVEFLEIRYLIDRTPPHVWQDGFPPGGMPDAVEIRMIPFAGEQLSPLLTLPIRVAIEAVR